MTAAASTEKLVRWVTWDRTKVAHAVRPHTTFRVGSYPALCGTFTPDAWDVGTHYETSAKRHCARCEKAYNQLLERSQT